MSLIIEKPLINQAINSSNLLSGGQKIILNSLVKFDVGIPIAQIMNLTSLSKQTVHFNLKKLLERGYVLRTKDMFFLYKVDNKKMEELLDRYIQTKQAES